MHDGIFWWLQVRVSSKTGCWIYLGKKQQGYGPYAAAYAVFRGDPILDLDHVCRNRACVNPWHLEPVTKQENVRRGVQARRALGERVPKKAERCTLALIRERCGMHVYITTNNDVLMQNHHGLTDRICRIGDEYWQEAEQEAWL